MTSSFWFDHSLGARAEICQIFFIGKKIYSEIIWPLQALLKILSHLSYHLGYWLQLQIILMTFITGIKFPLNYSLIWLGQKMVLFWLLKELLHQKWNWREQNYKVFWKNKLNFLFRLITLYLVWSGKHFQIFFYNVWSIKIRTIHKLS